jgi:hypothetical protein
MMSMIYEKEFDTYERAWAYAVRVTSEGRGRVEEFVMLRPRKYIVAVRMSWAGLP